jgi:hypothetical protein
MTFCLEQAEADFGEGVSFEWLSWRLRNYGELKIIIIVFAELVVVENE